jgi:hypothetical protein
MGLREMNIRDLILNILMVSIPEEYIITMCILLLLRQWQYISKEFWKENLIKVMLTAVIPIAIITNISKFIITINASNQMLMSIILFIAAIILLVKINNLKQFFQICGFTIMGTALFILAELFTLFICKYGLNIDIMTCNTNPFYNFIIVIPERIIEYGVLLFVYFKKNSLVQINISEIINQNKLLKHIIIIFTAIPIFLMWIMLKFVFIDNMLKALNFDGQLFVVIFGFSMIILLLLSTWIYIICIYPDEKYKYKKLKEEINYEKEHDC